MPVKKLAAWVLVIVITYCLVSNPAGTGETVLHLLKSAVISLSSFLRGA